MPRVFISSYISDDDLEADIKAHKTAQEIADSVGLTKEQIIERAHTLGLKFIARDHRMKMFEYPPELRQQVLEDAAKMGVRPAARHHNIPSSTLREWVVANQQNNEDDMDEHLQPALPTPTGPWAGRCWRLVQCFMRNSYFLVPRGTTAPRASAQVSSYTHNDVTRRAYYDTELVASCRIFQIHPALLDELSSTIAGNHMQAAEALGWERDLREGYALSSEEKTEMAMKACVALRKLGFYNHAQSDVERAAVADKARQGLIELAKGVSTKRDQQRCA